MCLPVGRQRLAVRGAQIAEHAGDGVLGGSPWEDLPSCGVRKGYGVGFVAAGEAVDDGTVEACAGVQHMLEFVDGDRETLDRSEDVGEPQSDEPNVLLVGGAEDEFFRLVVGRNVRRWWRVLYGLHGWSSAVMSITGLARRSSKYFALVSVKFRDLRNTPLFSGQESSILSKSLGNRNARAGAAVGRDIA